MKVITSIDDAIVMVGQTLGIIDWKDIDQPRIEAFADVTEDHKWIHVDAERAAAESRYGAIIARVIF